MSGKAMTALLAGLAACCLIAMGVIFATGAQAQSACGPADEVISAVTGPKWNEQTAFVGRLKTPNGPVPVMTFVNGKTGTWTMVARPGPEIACIVAIGDGFELSTDAFKPGDGT